MDRESGVLQSMGSQRVGHDWVTELNRTELNGVTKPASHNYWASTLEPSSCNESGPQFLQIEKSPRSNEDPAQPKINKLIKKKKRGQERAWSSQSAPPRSGSSAPVPQLPAAVPCHWLPTFGALIFSGQFCLHLSHFYPLSCLVTSKSLIPSFSQAVVQVTFCTCWAWYSRFHIVTRKPWWSCSQTQVTAEARWIVI